MEMDAKYNQQASVMSNLYGLTANADIQLNHLITGQYNLYLQF